MKTLQRTFLVGLLTVLCLVVKAQKHDYIWLSGYDSYAGYSSTIHYWFGITKFDFSQQSAMWSYDSLGINFRGVGCAMSDASGSLKFYTNGVTVRNYNDEIIGDSMHNGYFLQNLFGWYKDGIPTREGFFGFQNCLNPSKYDLIYSFYDTIDGGSSVAVSRLMRSQIDMSLNGGKGAMVFRDQIFSTSNSSNSIAAVKHGNGRDWWILTMKEGTSCYKKFLYSGDGIVTCPEQCFNNGLSYSREDYAIHRFSSDGNFMVSLDNEKGKADFFAFDRCAGELIFLEEVNFPEKFDSVDYHLMGGEFSSNSRYFYVCATKKLYQFDLQSSPISASKVIIGPTIASLPGPFSYNHAQMAPDGRIYVTSFNTSYYFSVINNPDQGGSSCQLQDTLRASSIISASPYYPNYRLSALDNSQCDTLHLSLMNHEIDSPVLTIYPNPASDYITIDYGNTNWAKGNVELEVLNALGQIVYAQTLPSYSGFQRVDVSHLPQGYYAVQLKRNAAVVAGRPFVKE